MNLSRVRRLAVAPILIAVAMLGATGIAQAQPKDSCVETVKAEEHAWNIYYLYDNLAKVTPNFSLTAAWLKPKAIRASPIRAPM